MQFKVQTYVPRSSLDMVRQAIGDAGGGIIGNYSHCSFVTEGTGYFLPLVGANPTIGSIGTHESVEEVKIEFVCEKEFLQAVIQAINQSSPYEETPIEIYQLVNLVDL